jgi:hypothetical protein
MFCLINLESAYILPAAVYLILSTSCYVRILQIINQYFLNASQDEIRTFMPQFDFGMSSEMLNWGVISYDLEADS